MIKDKKVKKDHRVEVHQLVKLSHGQGVQVLFPLDISYAMVRQLVEPRMQLSLQLSEPLMVLEMGLLHSIFQI